MKIRYGTRFPGPLGDMWAVIDEKARLVQLDFHGGRNAPDDMEELERCYAERGLELRPNRVRLQPVVRALGQYFRCKRTAFDLKVAPEGTEFQRRVWKALRRIPFGKTWSYAELARRVGRPGAARAVGAANGANPVSIVIPCHRVVGSDGSLTGYGGGMERKKALLELEGAI